MKCALHCTEIFTLKNMITHGVLDAQMNLLLSHISLSVPGCATFLFLETCYNFATEIIYCTTW